MDKPLAALFCVLKYRYAVCATIYPPPKAPVPTLNFQYRRCVRSLSVNKKLFVKAELIVPAGGAQKGFPILRIHHYRFTGTGIQLGNQVIFSCQAKHLLSFIIFVSVFRLRKRAVLIVIFRVGGGRVPAKHRACLHRCRLCFGYAGFAVVFIN